MLGTLANIFGYFLNFLYNIFSNYGVAIVIFSILVKIILLPLTIKQQRTVEKSTRMQEEMKALQFKYKNDPETLNREMMEMYKRENMSPLSGCFSSIIQIIIILAVFGLVRSPLTHMKKVDVNIINEYKNNLEVKNNYPEVQIIKEFGNEDKLVYLNMNFLGLDLSSIPSASLKDFKTLIIPFLYVISSVISTKMTLNIQKKENKDDSEETVEDMMQSTSKSMAYMMPLMAFSISLVAPLGLALYWLISNILMILERIFINKFILKKEEKN